jgi:hypothetical protein
MTALAPISDKLDPLIRRLASDEDGEVIACVRAISRQLGKAGASWHDLADRLTTAPDSAADSDAPPVFSDYAAAVEWLLASDCGDLSARDIDFLESMRGILRRWPPRPKQARWISALVERLGGWFDG